MAADPAQPSRDAKAVTVESGFGAAAAWHALPAAEVARRWETDPGSGLSETEAARRLARYGPNELEVVGRTAWYTVLLRQFTDILIIILVAAAAISLAVGDAADAVTILAIVLLNGGLGFAQEWQAERAMAALREMLSPRCTVRRDGRETEIETAALVPGDVVTLKIGDRVPADLRLFETLNLKIDEAALTGESLSVAKDPAPLAVDAPVAERACIAWMGTEISNGRGAGVVVATGMETEFGRIARLTQSVERETTPLQRKLGRLGRKLGLLSVAVSVLIAGIGWLAGKPLLEMFLTGVSLAVALVPEGLPAVVTITLALGIRAMVRRHALLRRLQAAETLGAASVICTDKTGTLTRNEMTVTRIWYPGGAVTVSGVGYEPEGKFTVNGAAIDPQDRPGLRDLLRTGLICNHATITKTGEDWRALGEPTEAALVVAAYKASLFPDGADQRVTEFSFNSDRKRMTIIVREGDALIAHVKGAPEVVLERSRYLRIDGEDRPMTDADRQAAEAAYMAMAAGGLRTLALARRHVPPSAALDDDGIEQDLTLLGIVGIIDPPRPEVPAAMRVAHEAGIHVIMITGDAAPTAAAIARQVGLRAARAVTGTALAKASDGDIQAMLGDGVVFARTTPEQKLRIVGLLQAMGHIVGMTGDGVNDAPALRKSDIGIAMGRRGTDVAKGAADMILTDDNFASIIGAVEEGRRQYENIKKFVRYLLSSNTGEVLAIFLNIVLGGPLILLPVQILWMNLVTDGLSALALGVEPGDRSLMRRKPRPRDEALVDRPAAAMVIAMGTYIGLATLALFQVYGATGDAALAQTVAFTGIIVMEKANVFNFRVLGGPIRDIGWFSNPWLLLAVSGTLVMQVCAVYVPFLQDALHTTALGWRDWAVIIAVAAPLFVVTETWKWWRSRRA
jgi:P-type Ca2+ transporter type 2C